MIARPYHSPSIFDLFLRQASPTPPARGAKKEAFFHRTATAGENRRARPPKPAQAGCWFDGDAPVTPTLTTRASRGDPRVQGAWPGPQPEHPEREQTCSCTRWNELP